MALALLETITTSLARFASDTRLVALRMADGAQPPVLGPEGWLVEAFAADDMVHGIGQCDVIVLSTSAYVDLREVLGKRAVLETTLADGSRRTLAGDIAAASMLGSEGGFARYRLRLRPWLWRLGEVRNSRVWQDRTVIEIIDEVFAAYSPLAQWRWSDEAAPFMEEAGARSYCCQYRESDLHFVQRLLTEEGLSWRVEQLDDGAGLVLFADSSQAGATPEDASSAAGGGIRFHGARVGEHADTIQQLQARRSVSVSLVSLLSYDYKAKQAASASAPSRLRQGRLPPLESYDVPGQYAYASRGLAQRYADLHMQAHEAAAALWHGRSTVRGMAAGTRVRVTQGPLKQPAEPVYVLLRVRSVGVNNLPSPAKEALAELFGPIPELLEELCRDARRDGAASFAAGDAATMAADFAPLIAEAWQSGYANSFDALAADVVWRPLRDGAYGGGRGVGASGYGGSNGRCLSRPTAHGAQTAIVVGPDGGSSPSGADELYCDRHGRVRIRFHWQDSGDATCWVRVAQRSAGGGMGMQFLPRIGQEVLVQFIENDIDRPVIVGALYNGQGEGGAPPTPGGHADEGAAGQPFEKAHDHAVSAQGNVAGGNSPLWHGASADSAGHRSNAAQWGVRSKEFGGAGYNQLLFDDTDGQGRVQLRSSHAASELNLGHLIYAADNYRGSLRGLGAELRTDGYGAVRAGAGLLVSSYTISHAAAQREPAGDNAPGMAMLKQAVQLGEAFSAAAARHETVALASHVGAAKASSSVLDAAAAPLKAMLASVSGMVDGGSLQAARASAARKDSAPGDGKLPHASDPLLALSARAGLGAAAGSDLQLANGETVALMSGADTQFVTGGQARVHSGQAIGVLGGAAGPGEQGLGVQLVAAQGAADLQAQADQLRLQARDDLTLSSASAAIDWAAAKRISLSTAGGANITIEGGNITVQCPGRVTIHAGKKSFTGPARLDYERPLMPKGELLNKKKFPSSL